MKLLTGRTHLLLFCLSMLVSAHSALALPDFTSAMRSVWRIRAENSLFCGTGFTIGPSRFVTTSHLANSLCSFHECKNLFFERTDHIGGQPSESYKIDAPKLVLLLDSLDLAIIEAHLPSHVEQSFLEVSQPQSEGSQVYSLSYSDCDSLRIHIGELLKRKAFWLETSLNIRHGASGAPILTKSGKVLGVIEQANSFLDALAGIFAKRTFSARGVEISASFAEESLNPRNILLSQKDNLLRYYTDVLTSLRDSSRTWSGLEFFSVVDKLQLDTYRSGMSFASPAFIQLGAKANELEIHFGSDASDLEELAKFFSLVLGANLERNGFRGSHFQRMAPSELRRHLLRKDLPEGARKELTSVIDSFEKNPTKGFYIDLLHTSLLFAAVSLSLLLFWAISIGYIFRDLEGVGLLKRLFVTASCSLILWPLSLLAYAFWKKRRLSD